MNLWGVLKAAAGFGLQLLASVKGSGNGKPSFSELLPTIVGAVLPAVDQAIRFQGLDTKEKVDAWITTLDAATGLDATALDIVKDLPADKEEQLFDHVLEAARIFAYCKIGVPGYKA